MDSSVAVYHGNIGKALGERRLADAGKDGSYLIRDSESVAGVYCLCVLCKGYVYTYRLHQDAEGSWSAETAADQKKRFFRRVKNLINAFEEPDQGIAIPLLYPVPSPSPGHSPLKEQQPRLDAQNLNQNHIQPLGKKNKHSPRVKPKKRPSL
ncbi:SH2 domain-containing protein 1A [Engraulis encrasicolus]|uniref:SH2 domain-containing protein 1A n=1 Tax=Engraulis encrasicolus TaxID=184585 RepID=UPI002FD643F8